MFVSRIIRERKKERDKIVIFSSSFYCLYFIFQFGSNVGDLDQVEVAIQNIFRVATEDGSIL